MSQHRSSLVEVRDPQVGDVVDLRYTLRREIARGGMGAVFEATQTYTGRTVAVKVLHSGFQFREDVRQRILREARALTIVRHPSVVEVLDAGVCDQAGPYVVMEMLEGRTLDGILAAKRRLSLEDTVHVGRQMLEALAFAHARGVVHRDLKPSNVFLCRNELGEEIVKLIDFGIAQVNEQRLEQGQPKLTKVGELLGTFDYMAPEQLLAKDVIDHRSDLYATAVTLYECLTGEVPYTGSYQAIVLALLGKQSQPDVRKLRPDVPEPLAKVIEQGLAEEPNARPEDALVFAEALAATLDRPRGRSSLLGAFQAVPGTRTEGAATQHGARREPHLSIARTISLSVQELEPIAESAAPTSAKAVPPPLPPGAQRRRYPRVPYVTPARIAVGSHHYDGRTEDISEGGMLVITDEAVPDSAEVTVRFALPIAGTMVTLAAKSRWVRQARGRGAAGLELIDPPREVREMIQTYVKLMQPAEG